MTLSSAYDLTLAMIELTLSEMSERIASGQDDVVLVGRRIRHWTNVKLIPTVGDAHSGRGRHRHYGPEGLLIAAILWELSRYNVPVGVLEQVSPTQKEYLDFVRDYIEPELVSDALDGLLKVWFVISLDDQTGKFDSYFSNDLDTLKQKLEADSVIILNVAKIARRVSKP